MNRESLPLFTDKESRALTRRHCERIGISIEVLEELLDAEIQVLGMGRRHGIFIQLEEILGSIDDREG